MTIKTILRDDGTISHLQMTKKAFFATSLDFRNKPGRTDVPMRLAYDPKGGGTVSVQVDFVCDHGMSLKVICNGCSIVTLKKKLAKLGSDPKDTRPIEAKLAESDRIHDMIQILETKLNGAPTAG